MAMASRQRDDNCRVAEREEQSDPDRTPAFGHEFAGDIVDRRNVVGVEGVPEAETVGERGRAKQNRIGVEGGKRPQPCGRVEDDEEGVDRGRLYPRIF